MATAKSFEDLKKHLKCAVCLDHFQEPKVLPCLHTYCKKCLEKVQKQSRGKSVITCPECRNKTEVPNGNLDSLPANFFMNNIMSVISLNEESKASSIKCENCDIGDPPIARCSVCSMFLCNFCAEAHRRGKRTKDHKLMSIEEVRTSSPVTLSRNHMCKEHEEEQLKLYCQTCEKAICRDCTLVKHRNHKYDFVKETYDKEKETILKLLRKTESKQNDLKQAIEKVSIAVANVHNAAKGVEGHINVWINQLIASLERQRTKLHNSLKGRAAAKVKELLIQQEQLEVAFSCVESSINFTERAFQDGSQVEVLDMKKQISNRLSNLNTSVWKLDPCALTSVYFVPEQSLLNQVEKVGHVVTYVAARSTVRLGKAEEGLMYNLVCGQTRMFHIQIRDENGQCCFVSNDEIKIKITGPSKGVPESITCVKSEPKGIGFFCFTYKPMTEGSYSMSVTVCGENISGSPFTWKATSWNLGAMKDFKFRGAFECNEKNVNDVSLHNGLYSWKIIGSSVFSVGVKERTTGRAWSLPVTKKPRKRKLDERGIALCTDTRDLYNMYLNLNKNRLFIERICNSELSEKDISGVNCPVTPWFQLHTPDSSVFLVDS